MDNKQIEDILKNKNEIFIFKIELVTKTYVQSIKLKSNKMGYMYYQIKDDTLYEVEDEKELKFLRENYEQEPNSIIYDDIIWDRSEYQKKYKIKIDNSEQQENLDLKPWVKDYVTYMLKNCKLFTSVYGKRYARVKMDDLRNVYIKDGRNKFKSGDCRLESNIINVYLDEDDSEYYSISELMNNKTVLATILHEGVHFVLKYSDHKTGMLVQIPTFEKYAPLKSKIKFRQLGRVLNEGLTEWIVEQAGLGEHVGSEYSQYLNFIKQIELAIGKKKTMRLGNCNLLGIRNIARLLKMRREDTIELLSKTDELNIQYNQYEKLQRTIQYIDEYRNIDKIEDEDKKEEIRLNFYHVKSVATEKDVDSMEYLKQNNLEPTAKNLKGYYTELLSKRKKMIVEIRSNCEDIIFEHFFKKEYEGILNLDNPPKQVMEKYLRLYNLINSKKEVDCEATRFKKSFEKVISKYVLSICEEMKVKYENGNLTQTDLIELISRVNFDKESRFKGEADNIYSKIENNVIRNFSKIVSPEYAEFVDKITGYLYFKGELNNLKDYSLKIIQSKEGKNNCIYLKNGEIDRESYRGKKTTQVNSENKNNYSMLFDFTLGLDEDFLNITRDFDKLVAQNPSANIFILNRIIVVDNGDTKSFYVVDNGIASAKVKDEVNINFAPERENNEIVPQDQIGRLGIIKKFRKKTEEEPTYIKDSKEIREGWLIESGIKTSMVSQKDIHQNNNSNSTSYTDKELDDNDERN